MEVQEGYHCAYQIHYHIVFPVKYRKALLVKEVEKSLQETAKGIEERYGLEIERLGSDEDHVPLLCGAHPKYAPGQVVRLFKSITGRELFRRHTWLKKGLWGGEFWTDGYYAAAVGERGNWSAAEKYVRMRGKEPKEVQLRLW